MKWFFSDFITCFTLEWTNCTVDKLAFFMKGLMKSEGAYNINIIFFYCCIEIYQPFVFLAFVSICQIFTLAYTVNMAVIVIVSSFLHHQSMVHV